MYQLSTFLVINELKQKYPITTILQVVDIPRSTYYYYCKQLEKIDKHATAKAEMKRIWIECNGNYGYRRMTRELRAGGIIINHKTVLKMMKQIGLYCHVKMRKYKSYKGEVGRIAPNLLDRDFKLTNRMRNGCLTLLSSSCSEQSCIYHLLLTFLMVRLSATI